MYWHPSDCDPYSATIDWCEVNYEFSSYVAEFWNTLSSFLFCVFGLYSLYVVFKVKGERVEVLSALLLVVVGLGSAAFHGTLRYTAQIMDEVPMIWCVSA